MDDPTKDIKKEDLLKPIEGEKLEQYKELEDGLSMTQLKTSRATMKGLYLQKKNVDIRRLYRNSKTEEGQKKYAEWQADVERMEKEVIRWELLIEQRKNEQKGTNKKA